MKIKGRLWTKKVAPAPAPAPAFLNQPAAQNENQYLTPRSAGRNRSIDEDILIRAITDLALVGSSADSRRCTKLKDLGYNLSQTSVYLRLLSWRKDSLDRKRHKKVPNVRLGELCIAMQMQLAKNPDRWFASTTVHHVKELAVLIGRKNVALLGKDDRALIPLGNLLQTSRAKFWWMQNIQ